MCHECKLWSRKSMKEKVVIDISHKIVPISRFLHENPNIFHRPWMAQILFFRIFYLISSLKIAYIRAFYSFTPKANIIKWLRKQFNQINVSKNGVGGWGLDRWNNEQIADMQNFHTRVNRKIPIFFFYWRFMESVCTLYLL